jgi:hypothetical protein
VNITRSFAWSYDPYDAQLPPPLCFTVPARSPVRTSSTLIVSPTPVVRSRKPKLMMDPSDPATWQRTYRFT